VKRTGSESFLPQFSTFPIHSQLFNSLSLQLSLPIHSFITFLPNLIHPFPHSFTLPTILPLSLFNFTLHFTPFSPLPFNFILHFSPSQFHFSSPYSKHPLRIKNLKNPVPNFLVHFIPLQKQVLDQNEFVKIKISFIFENLGVFF